MSDPTDISPEPESAPQPDVLVIPAEYFFVERVEVPDAVTRGELPDYAELSMEGLAPFPLEQLRWGFMAAPDGRQILIYAALNDRLQRAGYTKLEGYTWVLPDFATLHGARFAEAVEIVLQHEAHETRVFHPGGEDLPSGVEPIRSDAAPVKDPELAELAASTDNPTPLQLQLLPVKLNEQGLPVFRFETLSQVPVDGNWSPLSPGEATLWQADIRPAAYKGLERNARRTTAWITRIIAYAAIFALCLVLLEGFLFAGQFWLGTRQAKVDAQSTPVLRIEDKQSLMNKLEQVAQNELRPIGILEAANRIRISLGTTGIEYDEVMIEEGNRLTIEGKANTINELNAYTEALRFSGDFDLIDTKQLTRSGKTTFNVILDFWQGKVPNSTAPWPPAGGSEPPEAAVSSTEAETNELQTEGGEPE